MSKAPKIIAVHSFLRGAGKSHIAANVATLLALAGRRVCVVDISLQAPGIHFLFGLREGQISHSLNDYLWGRCALEQAALDVTPQSVSGAGGKIFLIPSSAQASEIARAVREGCDVELLNEGFQRLAEALNLDALVLDMPAGLSQDTLVTFALSDVLVVLLCLDQHEFQGTSVMVDVARQLQVPRIELVVNQVPHTYSRDEARERVQEAYGCEVGAVLPYVDELAALASSSIFALRYPDHPVTESLRRLAMSLAS